MGPTRLSWWGRLWDCFENGGGVRSLSGVRNRFDQIAIPALPAARVEIPQDSNDESEREFLMSTQDLYEELVRRTRKQGREQGREQEAKRALNLLYEARFGAMPRAIADAIEAAHATTTLERWLILIGTRSQVEIDAAIQAEAVPPAS